MTGRADDPWARLREQAREPDGRMAGSASGVFTPDGARRLYAAAAVVLASIRELVVVAEEIVQQRLDSFPDDDPADRTDRPHDESPGARFRSVRVRPVENEERR